MDGEVESLGNCCVCSSIEESELDQRHGVGGDCMFINESCIYETIRSQSLLMQNGRNVVRI